MIGNGQYLVRSAHPDPLTVKNAVQQGAGDHFHALRLLQPNPAARIQCQLLERSALLLPIPEIPWRSPVAACLFLWIERFYGHESSRIVRKPPQQCGVNNAEDRRVRADAQTERNDRDQREARVLQQ
jgi:hypothetical protein